LSDRCQPRYDWPGFYGEDGVNYPDNQIRFSVLAHAAPAFNRRVWRPDILLGHDWDATGFLQPPRRRTSGWPEPRRSIPAGSKVLRLSLLPEGRAERCRCAERRRFQGAFRTNRQ
jgi:hypothetical protein